MPAAARLGDTSTGHGCWPPRESTTGSPDVKINKQPAHRVDDLWAAHTCDAIPETHAGKCKTGSSTVFVNGKPLARIGDLIACDNLSTDVIAQGSGNVFVGG